MTATPPAIPKVTVPEMVRQYAALVYAHALTTPDTPRRLYHNLGDEARGMYETIVAVIAGYDDAVAIERVRDALADIAVASTEMARADHRLMVLRAAAKARTGHAKKGTQHSVNIVRTTRTEQLGAQASAIRALLAVHTELTETRKAGS